MEVIECPNCGKLMGFKRSLGFGTLFAAVLTAGVWLLLIPFYPRRCINCGSSRSSLHWNLEEPGKVLALFVCVGLIIIALGLTISRNEPLKPPIIDGPDYLASKAKQAKGTDHASGFANDHQLKLVPKLFGDGAGSDGRIYSIGLVAAYKGHIPPRTRLFVQGVISGRAGPTALLLSDEQYPRAGLVCLMSPEEYEDVAYLYHQGKPVQAYGEYTDASFDTPALRNCKVAGPTEDVVRPSAAQMNAVGIGQASAPCDTDPRADGCPPIPSTSPEVIYKVEPDFSDEARKNKIGGLVKVSLTVDEDGTPQNVHVVQGIENAPELSEKAIEAVKQYRFKPATSNGKPIPTEVHVEINFQIF